MDISTESHPGRFCSALAAVWPLVPDAFRPVSFGTDSSEKKGKKKVNYAKNKNKFPSVVVVVIFSF